MKCKPWTGKQQTGREYGYLYVEGKRWYAHRWVFYSTYGYLPKVVRHTCDNEWCVEPTHLLPGTQSDNLQDCFDRGRARRAQGEAVNTAKLKASDIPVIRDRFSQGDTVSAVARDYGVDRRTVRKIRDGQTWRTESSV